MLNAKVKNLTPILSQDNPSLDREKTADQIASLRKELGIQQKCLASEMEISVSYLSDLESANRDWNIKLFNKAKEAFGRLSK